ncbi:YidH family protein [Mesorhizobium captivum]|uniref:DUF202 domain-containing protein n=1 Tax=Mesorhizobium captivum TaxID=3072319 RepID=A0ABU4Z1Z5_9HYPH|nr:MULTISPECIES: DUF202 domain-containing protein [unclassified Mesorhizobium]MDX8444462.1 DUF202 domain-containing protein [Mesorhizobium sp. VK3C]MDX8492099.1 DUF202 domain-containing protein [Mesorhizobium sp. VK22B]MDX8506378.1 DUF202 domain-containing protein [Mesorhizobium sp. VK22E]MDX8516348.1 DUF202 domain-containing protein [Mesorhizobium sp. VK23E]
MTSQNVNRDQQRFDVHVTAESHFSWLRTRLSLERTMMSWLRTSIACIGFGFTIVQFFDRLGTMESVDAALRPQAPRYLGLTLIAAGILALAISLVQYRWGVRYLWGGPYRAIAGAQAHEMQTPIMALAIVLMIAGLTAFFAVLFRAV